MMFDGSCGLTATNGSSSLFTQLTSPGNMNAETSHDANGLVLDAWLTDVVVYGPAEATATGKRINSADTAAAVRGKPFFMLHLHRIASRPLRASSCDGRRTVKRAGQTSPDPPARAPLQPRRLAQSLDLVLPENTSTPATAPTCRMPGSGSRAASSSRDFRTESANVRPVGPNNSAGVGIADGGGNRNDDRSREGAG